MTMYYLGLFLWSHLIAGTIAAIIDYLFYKEEITETIEEFNQEYNFSFKLTVPIYIVVHILGGWYMLFSVLKSIFNYYFERDDDDE
jgi:multisubunit Na+/H+ antiporter MnhB subunit